MRTRPSKLLLAAGAAILTLTATATDLPRAGAYPLDGAGRIGVRRLDGYLAAQERPGVAKLPPGALLGVDDIHLNLLSNREWDFTGTPKDPTLQAALEATLKRRDPSYAVTIVDITDPDAIAWAGMREDQTRLPGSVGKVLCMIALFDGLRLAFPEPEKRLQVLREHVVVATDWATGDPHTVPKFDAESATNRFSIIVPGDRFTLAEWVDHMVSPSANSAGAMVWREAILLRAYGADYPPSPEETTRFLRETPASELTRLSQVIIAEPLTAAGIDLSKLRQGSFWTRVSKARVPGIGSYASPRELARVLVRIEQGRMVDEWSSLEMKRFLYMTKKRYRYAYPPELAAAAIFFKSGSFYQCRPEPDFKCGKYQGNETNLMNSIAIVESPAERGPEQKRYVVSLLSNVLRTNSAWDHSRIAAAIEEIVRTRAGVAVRDGGSTAQQQDVGRSD